MRRPTEFQKTAFKGVFAFIIISGIIGLVLFLIFLFAFFLPMWNKAQQGFGRSRCRRCRTLLDTSAIRHGQAFSCPHCGRRYRGFSRRDRCSAARWWARSSLPFFSLR
jgi:hypothetical protein